MFQRLDFRLGHYTLLLLTWGVLCLPNLGSPSLYDIDEGKNSEAAHEMWASDNYIVPYFNYQMRVDKPALLYWLQAAAYTAFGLNELSARLPSALAGLLAVLTTYALGRRLFGAAVGLLGGIVLASAVAFSVAAHFANPDALLNACLLLTMFLFWRHYQRGGRGWSAGCGASCGLAVLAKGPVGLVLPAAAGLLFLLWQRQLRRLWDPRFLLGLLAFLLVAAPWYVWVGAETKWEWVYRFLVEHNFLRSRQALENHGGSVFYYPLVLVVGLAPWSAFLTLAGWHAYRGLRRREDDERPALRFLTCWVAVYLAFFTLVATKLPNYILPLYPAAALLTARLLVHWWQGRVRLPTWAVQGSLAGLALTGLVVSAGLVVASGVIPFAFLRGRSLPGLEAWAGLGGLLVLGALAAGWLVRRERRGAALGTLAGVAVLFTAALIGWGSNAVERHKAARDLVQALPDDQLFRDVRVAAFAYFQPSLVFYCQREVTCLQSERQALDFLSSPLPAYLFLPAQQWEGLRGKVAAPCRLLGRRYDLYSGNEVVLVTNQGGP
jgi:4-amino-4-deoxy-L-arabinose transferase-like glycosyltransferase